MNSGNNTNCAPRVAACSAKGVARVRLASMSWSTDGIWTTAIRNARSAASADCFDTWTRGAEEGPATATTNSNTAQRSAFIVVRSRFMYYDARLTVALANAEPAAP